MYVLYYVYVYSSRPLYVYFFFHFDRRPEKRLRSKPAGK